MGLCCSSRRDDEIDDSTDSIPKSNKNLPNLLEDYNTEAINEKNLKEVFCLACKDENLLVLLAFLKNNSKLSFNSKLAEEYENTWINKPLTISDLASCKIYSIISENISYFKFDEEKKRKFLNEIGNINLKTIIIEQITIYVEHYLSLEKEKEKERDSIRLNNSSSNLMNRNGGDIKKGKFKKNFLYSNCKFDYCLLIYAKLSNVKEFTCASNQYQSQTQFSNKEEEISYKSVKIFMDYLKMFSLSNKMILNVNYKEHIILTLEILRNYYVNSMNIRIEFINNHGVEILKKVSEENTDSEILSEVIFNIQDLIYVSNFNKN